MWARIINTLNILNLSTIEMTLDDFEGVGSPRDKENIIITMAWKHLNISSQSCEPTYISSQENDNCIEET